MCEGESTFRLPPLNPNEVSMGRLRASIQQVVGVKFDRAKTNLRLLGMGIVDTPTRERLLSEMEKAHSRTMFLQAITKKRR